VAPLEATPDGSAVAVELETGRTHQIRVHLAAIGHPLAGDWLYGDRNAARPMLHAAELEMMHPLTNEPLRVAAPVPDDFREEARRRGIRHWERTEATPAECS
jgi:23S rRNA pseudouridine1911/1915/1917 synthase